MPEVTTPQTAAPAAPPTPPKSNVKKRRPKTIRNAVIAIIVVAALAVGGVFLYRFLTKQDAVESDIQAQPVSYGTIQSKVSGSGSARAKESAAITLTADGTVREVFVAAGDMVYEGQPLYTVFSQAAYDNITIAQNGVAAAEKNVQTAGENVRTAQAAVDELYQELAAIRAKTADLTVTAPFAGKLTDVQAFASGQELSQGTTIATLVNDKQLKLSLYFSYAYEDDIYVGQSVTVSIPAVMGSFTGKVEKINKVSYISPEGAVHFEVVVVFDNPRTLTAGMSASAILTAADGAAIYPYGDAKTEYYEIRTITTLTDGPVSDMSALMNYADVTAGQTLLVQGPDAINRAIEAKEKEIEAALASVTEANKGLETVQQALDEANTKLEEAVAALEDFDAVSPISGTVTSCTLVEGEDVKAGTTVITISNTTSMVVEITVDDRNIAFVQPGMEVELSDWYGNVYIGNVSSINIEGASAGNGMTSYPVTLTVDNYAGTLTSGMYLSYSFVASQSENCMMIPMQSVKYVSDADGETYSVVFIQADERPENAVDLDIPETQPGQTPLYPSPSDGYYPVPVETGLNDDYNVEIKSGLNGDETVFVNYYVESAYGW